MDGGEEVGGLRDELSKGAAWKRPARRHGEAAAGALRERPLLPGRHLGVQNGLQHWRGSRGPREASAARAQRR